MKQAITSAGTSLNQVPAVYRLAERSLPGVIHNARSVLDYGGGRYDTFTNFLAEQGVRSFVYDPYNRSATHNAAVRSWFERRPADITIISNVLNVVKETEARLALLRDAYALTAHGGHILITVYEGNRSARGGRTSRGWQAHRPTKKYLQEIATALPSSKLLRYGKLIDVVRS